jgi:transposase
VLEATLMDRRWQLALDGLDGPDPPVSTGTLVGLRARLMRQPLDRRLSERTSAGVASTTGFSARALRGALDRRPLWGAGTGEASENLLGHARHTALGVIARQQGRRLAAVAVAAGAPVGGGARRWQAARALDGDDGGARSQGVPRVRPARAAGAR